MNVSALLKPYLPLLGTLLLSHLSQAQSDADRSWLARTEVRTYPTYFEKITYNGKHQEYYTVNTYLKDSTLYRIDNFKQVNEGTTSAYNYQQNNGKVLIRQGPAKIMYGNGQVYVSAVYDVNELQGPFMVFYNDGAIKRKERYQQGHLKESHCYNPDGAEQQPCEAFYQLPRFTGDRKALKTYLETKIQPIVATQSFLNIQIRLTINEIGQVSHTTVVATQSSPALVSAIEQIIRSMPHWNPIATDWTPARIDSVPTSEIWTIYVYRKAGFLYVSFS